MAIALASPYKALCEVREHLTPPLISQVPAITNEKYDWNTHCIYSEPRVENVALLARGCAGEYVPVVVLAHCGGGMTNFVAELSGDDPAFADTDIRWVKWWWQSGRYFYENSVDTWTPELLLHDFDLVQSSKDERAVNRFPDHPQDAATLQPMTIPDGRTGYTQGIWLTIHIPKGTPPGEHWTTVRLTSDQTPDLEVPLKVYVWPFELVRPRVDYSIYYRAHLHDFDVDPPPISSEWKNENQMRAELANMARHGVVNPTMTIGPDPKMIRALGMRRAVGCDNSRIFNQACGVGAQLVDGDNKDIPVDSAKYRSLLDWAEASSRSYLRFFSRWGVKEFFRYGPDEGNPETLKRVMEIWKRAQAGGGKMYSAVNIADYEDWIDGLDVIVTTWHPFVDVADRVRKLHARGFEVYFYGNPQCGNEQPAVYRRNQGVRTWAYDADGSMDYAWQHVFGRGHAWDDFAVRQPGNSVYRSHMMTYPTVDGCVDTIQWEGFAAGITDCAYLTTLEAKIEETRDDAAAQEALEWLRSVRNEATMVDLDAMRQQCAQWIVKLGG